MAVAPRGDRYHVLAEGDEDVTAMAGPSLEETPLLGSMSSGEGMEGKRTKQYVGALAACLSAMAAGTTMGWTSAAHELKSGKGSLTISDDEFSWTSAFLAIGAFVAAIPLGSLANAFGRKVLLIGLVPIMVAGWIFLAWANSVWMLFVGRMLCGAVTGTFCVVTPMFTGEIAEDDIRGVLGSFFQLLITGGILFVYFLDALNVDLFYINIACGCIPIAMAILFSFFPDSPRWYLSKGRKDDARKSLETYRGKTNVSKELQAIEESLEKERAQKLPFTQAFVSPVAKKGLLLALSVMFFQQFSGINAVIFYASQIFTDAGVNLEPSISTVIVGCCQVVSTYVSTLLIDRAGRRLLLIVSGAFMALAGAVLGLYFYLKDYAHSDTSSLSWLPILCMVVFIVMFSIGYGPIPWLYMGEIFSDQIKGPAMAIATVVNWLSVFVVTKFFEQVKGAIGSYSTFWGFAGISLLSCFFVYFLLIETKGKSFTQILSELGDSSESSPSNELCTAPVQGGNEETSRH